MAEEESARESNGMTPDVDWLNDKLIEMRKRAGTVNYPGSTNLRMQFELTLYETEVQERYIDTLVRSIESQDKLARSQTYLAWGAVVFAFIQVVLMLCL